MPQNPVQTTLFVSRLTAGQGITLTPAEGTGIVEVSVGGTEDPAAITGGANPFPITGEAAASATAAGGAVTVAGAPGGATSGAGGAVSIDGGAATGGNSNGGAAAVAGGAAHGTGTGGLGSVTGGAASGGNGAGGIAEVVGGQGAGTGNGGAAEVVGGVGGATSGAGGAAVITGGAAGTGSNANGGDVNLTPGAKDGTGVAGVVRIGGVEIISQGAPGSQDTAATLTAAQILAGILTSNPSGAINLQLPLATAMDTALPTAAAGDAFDFSVISLAGSTNLPTLTINTGWTLVGAVTFTAVAGNAGRFRARKTGAGAWTLYRLS